MNIVVLAGGLSSETDVSFASSGNIANSLTKSGHKVLLVDVYKGLPKLDTFENLYNTYKKDDYSYKIPNKEPDLAALKEEYGNTLIGQNVLEICQMADVVFLGLHGGIGENGQLQATLDAFDIPYTGSGYIGCMLSMDKSLSKELMVAHNIPTAPYEVIDLSTNRHFSSPKPPFQRGCPEGAGVCSKESAPHEQKIANSESHVLEKPIHLAPPYVIKPLSGGSSVGVTIVKTQADIPNALKYAKEYENQILVEKFIEGREFSVGVLDGAALPAIEIVPKNADFFDFSSKYQGTTDEICPADIPPELETKLRELALKVHNTLRLGSYSRSEFIVDKDQNIYCLESNSLPGLTSESLLPKEARVAGIGYDELCEKIVKMGKKR